jgi:hypothetical protein
VHKEIRRAVQARERFLRPPTEEANPMADAEVARERFNSRSLWTFAHDDEIDTW